MTAAACCLTIAAAELMAAPAFAKDDDEPAKRAAPVQKIYDCRSFTNDAARLACFDASIDRSGKYRILMEDGAVWQQIDTARLPREPKPGQKVKIRVASMGSYFANVNDQRAIRMKRDH